MRLSLQQRLSRPDNQETWSHDKFNPTSDQPYLVSLSNLHYNVSEPDLVELFGGKNSVLKCEIDYDISGRSEGTAKLVFVSRTIAENYQRRYHGQKLDGNELKITLVRNVEDPINKKSGGGSSWKQNKGKNLDDRLGKSLDDRLGKKKQSLDDRLGPKMGSIEDRLGPKLESRLGKKVKPKKNKVKAEPKNEREIKSYGDIDME